ncbi:MAG TPA: beta-ketoacyl synthase N-terminal-like domain-containing protein [Streptosporangiaceae bacterium]|nr:beta-ketoacyl synthase N-terminal-like domain-containing protein [Streptosporangiaceae bacterium]
MAEVSPALPAEAIAVIGMSCRFPGARSVDEYWRNLCDGVETIRTLTADELTAAGVPARQQAGDGYVPARGVLGQADFFDADYFSFAPREAELTDPQQRMFLECTEVALQDAGYDPQRLRHRVGVFAGAMMSSYLHVIYDFAPELGRNDMSVRIGNDVDFLAARTAYKLNLLGPAVTVQTACSTGLVAIHLACQSLLSGECTMAVAGAVSVHYPEEVGYDYEPGSICSSDGHCRAFDVGAQGFVGGNGCGAVILKPLETAIGERDTIRSVILGSAINNDGAVKVGFTAPSVRGQRAVIAMAHAAAGTGPASIGYVEAHGTGTPLGDPVEVEALTQAFAAEPRRLPCQLGSVKPNIGHLDAAAGVAGFIKASLVVEHGLIPPTLHFTRPNPNSRLGEGSFTVAADLTPFPAGTSPRRAGVSSFGVGGTNAHAVLQEYSAPVSEPDDGWQLLPLSARSEAVLDRYAGVLARHLRTPGGACLADTAYTLQTGRRELTWRMAVIARSADSAGSELLAMNPAVVIRGRRPDPAAVAFAFPGQGTEYPGMARELMASQRDFAAHLRTCLDVLAESGAGDVASFLLDAPDPSAPRATVRTDLAQPALFAVQYALAQVWMAWGVTPACLLGHSLGELTAAAVAQVFSLPDAARIIVERGRLLQASPAGSMRVVFAPAERVAVALPAEVSVAAVNGPHSTVISGPAASVDAVADQLGRTGLRSRQLLTQRPFHSASTAAAADALAGIVAGCRPGKPVIPFVSNLTGDWISAEQAVDPGYWAAQLRQPVRFADGLRCILRSGVGAILEVGYGHTLTSLAADNIGSGSGPALVPSLPGGKAAIGGPASLLRAGAQLWVSGVTLNWAALHGGEPRRRVRVPTYPFDRVRYSLYPASAGPVVAEDQQAVTATQQSAHPESARPGSAHLESARPGSAQPRHGHPRPALPTAYRPPLTGMQERLTEVFEAVLGIAGIGADDSFFELGGDSLVAVSLIARVRELYGVDIATEDLFEWPTVAGLDTLIAGTLAESVSSMDAAQVAAFLRSLDDGECAT